MAKYKAIYDNLFKEYWIYKIGFLKRKKLISTAYGETPDEAFRKLEQTLIQEKRLKELEKKSTMVRRY